LLCCHKGVDLHVATAERVMQERLHGGDKLVALRRGEYYTYWGEDPAGRRLQELLAAGRYYNPNKHHYGTFTLSGAGSPWFEMEKNCRGATLPYGWPGEARGSDLTAGGDLFTRLLGGTPQEPLLAVDVCTFPLGECGPLLGGVLWRLVLRTEAAEAAELADRLVVTRGRRDGLLVNPHMHGWLLELRGPVSAEQPA
jgi:hypothetical protein